MQTLEGNFEGHYSSLRTAFTSSIVNAEIESVTSGDRIVV